MPPADTSPAVHRAQIQTYRRMLPAERMAIALAMSDDVQALAGAGIRRRHPEYDDDTVRIALWRLRLGTALFRAAFPERPLYPP